jgi:hypothetical protein
LHKIVKTDFYIGMRNQVGRRGLYSGHYSRVFAAPKNAQNAETKHWSGAVPIRLLALLALTTSAYSSLGVLQGLNPRHQLLKVSVYHSATSAILQWNAITLQEMYILGIIWEKVCSVTKSSNEGHILR